MEDKINETIKKSICENNSSNSFMGMILKHKKKFNLDYNDLDFQKGETSPRILMRKRKLLEKSDKIDLSDSSINLGTINPNSINLMSISNENKSSKIANKIKSTFESYLDFVHDSYFETDTYSTSENNNVISNNLSSNETSEIQNMPISSFSNFSASSNGFRFSSLDLLLNPLRRKFIWETWSPLEISIFECCVCKFNKSFDLYSKIIKSKTKDEIISFYYYWKQSKYYNTWKLGKSKRIKK